ELGLANRAAGMECLPAGLAAGLRRFENAILELPGPGVRVDLFAPLFEINHQRPESTGRFFPTPGSEQVALRIRGVFARPGVVVLLQVNDVHLGAVEHYRIVVLCDPDAYRAKPMLD